MESKRDRCCGKKEGRERRREGKDGEENEHAGRMKKRNQVSKLLLINQVGSMSFC